jgi:hypothetical protein
MPSIKEKELPCYECLCLPTCRARFKASEEIKWCMHYLNYIYAPFPDGRTDACYKYLRK